MNPEHTPLRTLIRPLRWLLWSWCVCFLGVSLMAPASAALMMMGSGEVDSTAHSMNHQAVLSDSDTTSHAVHHHGADALYCETCSQDMNCLGNCLHCSACHFSVLSTPAVSLFNTTIHVSEKGRTIRTTALPDLHTSPPYRPPIALF